MQHTSAAMTKSLGNFWCLVSRHKVNCPILWTTFAFTIVCSCWVGHQKNLNSFAVLNAIITGLAPCMSLQKYLNRKPHTLSTAYLLHSLHSSTSTVLVSTGFSPRFHVTSHIMEILSETTPPECIATTSLAAVFSVRSFSRLPLMAATKEQPSHTWLLFPDYKVTCNPSSILYSLLNCLQYTKFINYKKCFRVISYGKNPPTSWCMATCDGT